MTLSKQEEREKRFYKKWEELRLRDNTSYEEIPADIQLKAFIQSEIDLALAERDREVVEVIKGTIKKSDTRSNQWWKDEGKRDIINLITNK